MLHICYRKLLNECIVLFSLVRAGVPVCDILCVYCTAIRSILEYACPVWHSGVKKKLSKVIERVQKTLLKPIVLIRFI